MSVSLDENSPVTWWFMLLLSTFMSGVFLYMIPQEIQIHRVMTNGDLVTVEILQTRETTFGRRHSHWLEFKYQNVEKSIKVSYNFFNHIKGQPKTELLHLSEYPDLFMPLDYNYKSQFVSLSILTCFFVFMVPFSGFKLRRTSGK
jgi:hypothetical protein